MSTHFDVVVVGGGPSGIGAAVAAGKMGARTAIVERHDVLGGMGTAALVNNFCPAHIDGSRLIIGGVFGELRQRLIGRKAIYASPECAYAMEPYNPTAFHEEASVLCSDAGVTQFLSHSIQSCDFDDRRDDKSAFITLDDGIKLAGKSIVDATGDARVAFEAGVPFTFGDQKNAVMPLTYCYKMGPINLDAAAKKWPWTVHTNAESGERYFAFGGAEEQVKLARDAGELSIPRDGVPAVLSVPGEPQNVTVNFGRVNIKDPTDKAQLAAAEEEGLKQVKDGIAFFRKYLPGFENVELLELARQIGVRESRQIRGLYTLTGEDVLQCRQFADVIAQCCYAVDIHDPHSDRTKLIELPRGSHFDIPLRCLIPAEGPDNLVVAGRCISATQEAMSAFRVAPSVMAIGEAAGVVAALAAQQNLAVQNIEYSDVREKLLANHGILS